MLKFQKIKSDLDTLKSKNSVQSKEKKATLQFEKEEDKAMIKKLEDDNEK